VRAAGGPADPAPVAYHAWTDRIAFTRAEGRAPYTDPHTGITREWEFTGWTSPTHRPDFAATRLVPSWNADTPAGSWIEIRLQGTYRDGRPTPWYVLGRWARGEADIMRTSVGGQSDGRSRVDTDTLVADHDPLVAYRVGVVLHRLPGSRVVPAVRRIGVVASALPDRYEVPASRPSLGGRAVELALPRYSQDVHQGEYPQYDGGGEAWCSPTSTETVVEYWGCRPSPADLAWIKPSYPDHTVIQAARATYDHLYRGCGNWPFNTAYAASYPGLEAAVVRFRGLGEAERLLAKGVPVVASLSFTAEELDGAGYSTAGHLVTIAGFTAAGDVVVHDPATRGDAQVRRVYRRRQFENVWLRTLRRRADGSTAPGAGGAAYLIRRTPRA